MWDIGSIGYGKCCRYAEVWREGDRHHSGEIKSMDGVDHVYRINSPWRDESLTRPFGCLSQNKIFAACVLWRVALAARHGHNASYVVIDGTEGNWRYLSRNSKSFVSLIEITTSKSSAMILRLRLKSAGTNSRAWPMKRARISDSSAYWANENMYVDTKRRFVRSRNWSNDWCTHLWIVNI